MITGCVIFVSFLVWVLCWQIRTVHVTLRWILCTCYVNFVFTIQNVFVCHGMGYTLRVKVLNKTETNLRFQAEKLTINNNIFDNLNHYHLFFEGKPITCRGYEPAILSVAINRLSTPTPSINVNVMIVYHQLNVLSFDSQFVLF